MQKKNNNTKRGYTHTPNFGVTPKGGGYIPTPFKKGVSLQSKRGYTIVETMIAVSLFLVITTIGMGSLLNANLVHEKSQNMRSILDNLSFVMEDISRNLRTGSNYHCFVAGDTIPAVTSTIVSTPKSCANGWAISFESSDGLSSNDGIDDAKDNDQWIYYIALDNSVTPPVGRIWKSTEGPYSAASFIQLTPNEVAIDTDASGFSVLGAEGLATDSQEPLVNIRLVGTITFKDVVTPFSLQTSVSQRLVDI